MSDTDLDVSSLASADDGVLVFPEDDGEEEEEEEDYETEEEEELLFEEDSEERSGVRTSSPPFLLVPEEDLELGRSSIAITVPQVETPKEYKDDEKVSVASSFVSSVEGGAAIGESIFRDEHEHEGDQPRPSSLQPPRAHSKKSMASSPGSGQSRSVSFNTPIQTSITFNASNTTSRREEKKPLQIPSASSVIHKQRSSSRINRTPSPAFSPVDIVDGRQRQHRRSIVKKKRKSHRKKHTKPIQMIPTFQIGQGMVIMPTDKHIKSIGRSGGSSKKKHGKKNKRDIAVSGVPQFSDLEDEDEDDYYAPPKHLSPRSAAQYVKNKLKEGSKRRKKTRGSKRKRSSELAGQAAGEGGKKKRSKRKGKKKGKKKKKSRKEKSALSSDDEVSLRPGRKPVGPAEQHFNPVPRSLYKKRCLFSAEANPLQCTICNGIHYRTKRNFAANLKIIMNVNAALTGILNEMRNRMKKIDSNLARVKRNLEFMEDLYEGVFRKVNRLIS